MASGITINAASVKRALGQKSKQINEAIEKVLNRTARKLSDRAKKRAPRGESGKLARSIGARVSKNGRYSELQFTIKSIPGKRNPRKDPAVYWSLVEYGGVTRGRNGRMAIPVGEEDQYTARQAIDNPKLIGFQRLITLKGGDIIYGQISRYSPLEAAYILVDRVRNQKRPFLKPALKETIPELKRDIAAAIAKIISTSSAGKVSSTLSRSRSGAVG